VLKKLIL